jgi:hypothetical protein
VESIDDVREFRRKKLEESPVIQRLMASNQYGEIIRLLQKHKPKMLRWKRNGETVERPSVTDIRLFLFGTVEYAMRGPGVSERMTAAERKKKAQRIQAAVKALSDELEPFFNSYASIPFQFQAHMDSLALDIAADHANALRADDVEVSEEEEHRARYTVYDLLMNRPGDYLDTLSEAAEWWGRTETLLGKPNHPNAERLYFIKVVTNAFCREFGKPLRAVTLALTSVYFDTGGLDEAALAKIAPEPKPKPYKIPAEELERLRAVAREHGVEFDSGPLSE